MKLIELAYMIKYPKSYERELFNHYQKQLEQGINITRSQFFSIQHELDALRYALEHHKEKTERLLKHMEKK